MQKQKEEQHSDSFVSPSFSSYSTDQLAIIAEKVGRVHYLAQNDDSDFEFAAFRKADHNNDHDFSLNDTVFPLFNRDLLKEHRSTEAELRLPIRRILIAAGEGLRSESHQPPSLSSSSSSSDDDLEGIPPGTYCVWTPNSPQASPSSCKKSNSTGSSPSSKRWKLLNFLRRSKSDGKEPLVFLAAPAKKDKATVAAQEDLYLKRLDKRRSYLPYKEELIAIRTSRLGKAFLPSVHVRVGQ
ncbi:uncharacterized protein LOC130935709 [Arachis stenosperma]|uniref:uncharacterized protein LOC130935709 n=1 Tax=Arachis stenosperma TaxID=217475 RepID=UPI0025AC4D43|nr:uncharacterized protein LOC130935709 [Arachis stenosperma]